MNVQYLNSGSIVVVYGEPKPYQSALRIYENHPTLVLYKCSQTGHDVGKVYRSKDGRWYLATRYIEHWRPLEVFAKYEGFLLLNRLHSRPND